MEQFMPFIWIGFAVVMAVCEAFTSQLVSLWFVLGAVAAAIVTIFTPSVLIQSIVFVGVSLLALIVTKPLVNKIKKNNIKVSTNSDRLIGKTGIMLCDIDLKENVGQVKVEGEIWSAKSDFVPLKKDSKVYITAIEGVKLIVKPVSAE